MKICAYAMQSFLWLFQLPPPPPHLIVYWCKFGKIALKKSENKFAETQKCYDQFANCGEFKLARYFIMVIVSAVSTLNQKFIMVVRQSGGLIRSIRVTPKNELDKLRWPLSIHRRCKFSVSLKKNPFFTYCVSFSS